MMYTETRLSDWIKQTPAWLKAGITVVISFTLSIYFAFSFELLLGQLLTFLGAWAAINSAIAYGLHTQVTPLYQQRKLTIGVFGAFLNRLVGAMLTFGVAYVSSIYLLADAHHTDAGSITGGLMVMLKVITAILMLASAMLLTAWALAREIWTVRQS